MDVHIKKLNKIQNYIQLASVSDSNGLARLYYMKAIELLQELLMDLNKCMLDLENVGEQPKE